MPPARVAPGPVHPEPRVFLAPPIPRRCSTYLARSVDRLRLFLIPAPTICCAGTCEVRIASRDGFQMCPFPLPTRRAMVMTSSKSQMTHTSSRAAKHPPPLVPAGGKGERDGYDGEGDYDCEYQRNCRGWGVVNEQHHLDRTERSSSRAPAPYSLARTHSHSHSESVSRSRSGGSHSRSRSRSPGPLTPPLPPPASLLGLGLAGFLSPVYDSLRNLRLNGP
ncbi:hypothetical protein B0H14DRAFT_3518777 [Mycena olivaceomarginata]|nr:hypothetical protein B0H14DRAFT_3518777 [Mycena olivaceomarginata]